MCFPFFGQEFTFTQPDGGRIRVRGWGDQDHAVFETPDGYTVVRDPVTGFYNYAITTAEGDELRSAGVRVGLANPAALGLRAGARAAARVPAAAPAGLPKPRWVERLEAQKAAARAAAAAHDAGLESVPLAAPPARQTVGDYTGLLLLIDFPDVPATVSRDEWEAFCNEPGYTGFDNHGSVFDYFFDNSAGKLRYRTTVAPYYTAANPRSYYTAPGVTYGERARDLIKEALAHHLAAGFDFSGLTADAGGGVFATNALHAGPVVNNWSQGLWPHASRLAAPYPLAAGVAAVDYQITAMGAAPALGTYCHENGHMLCDFPDLYRRVNNQAGVGEYCLMGQGSNADPKNPTQIGAYLKHRAGWGNPAVPVVAGAAATATAGRNHFFIHARSPTEYFILENRFRDRRDAALADSGLAIWHVDELGSNFSPESAPAGHERFECVLVQADGRDDLGFGSNVGDTSDLFRADGNARFAADTTPPSRWWDGTPSGLTVEDVSPAGEVVTFRFG